MVRRRDDPDEQAAREDDVPPPGIGWPPDGQLVWVPPSGEVREVLVDPLRSADAGHTTATTGACPACGFERSVEVVVREHRACGHVGLDGFIAPASVPTTFICPKCDRRADEAFPPVASVHCCLACGHVLGVPVGER